MEEKDKAQSSEEKRDKGGLFTGRLTWWQILLGLALVAYLLYGKIQGTKADNPGTPSAPLKSK